LIERQDRYVRVFDALLAEQSVLVELYAPLMARLGVSGGTLKKLAFSVGNGSGDLNPQRHRRFEPLRA